jgi:hypothetical protein
MDVHQLGIGHRRYEKLALNGLRLALAGIVTALGCSLLFVARVAEDLARDGYGPGFRILLGAFHLAGGIALLLPQLAEKVAIVLGLFVAGGHRLLAGGGGGRHNGRACTDGVYPFLIRGLVAAPPSSRRDGVA